MAADTVDFAFERNAHALPEADRRAVLTAPGFGQVFTDHMIVIPYTAERGWHDGAITPRRPLTFDPACSVLHYAQEIFEGMKAYRVPGAGAALFRPEANARRFRASAERMAMPPLPEELFLAAVRAFVRTEADWIPDGEGTSLYLRPFMFASETFLGVRPAREYRFMVIGSPAGNYFKAGAAGIALWATEHYIRAAPGGTGAAKCGGNYASGLLAQAEATAAGCDQVLFLDAIERRYVEELAGMNVFFVFNDGSLATPPLDGTILPGITRDSLITLARDGGREVREERYALEQWRADAASGRLTEAFACGTAAVVTPIREVRGSGFAFPVGDGGPGPVTAALRSQLVAIQRGTAPDPHGWLEPLS